MESDNGFSHSHEKTHKKISSPYTKEIGIINEKNIENKVENKTSESGSLSNFTIYRATITGNTDEKLVGTSSLNNSEKLEVDSIENKDEKSSVRKFPSNPINKEQVNKIKGDEKSLQIDSCSNLLEASNTEDNGEIKSFESSFSSSQGNIEDKNKDQTTEISSSSILIEFVRVLNTESTEEKISDRNESSIHERDVSLPLTSLKQEVPRGCVYDPNTADEMRTSGFNKDLLERLNELPRAAGQLSDPSVAAAALQHVAGDERRGSKNFDHDPDPSRRPEPPEDTVHQSDLYEAVSADGDERDYLNDIQEFYEKLCCSEDGLVIRAIVFGCVGIFCCASVLTLSLDPSLLPLALIFTIISTIYNILFFINLVKILGNWILAYESSEN